MIDLDALLADDPTKRAAALRAVGQAPDYVRASLASKLGPIAREAAAALSTNDTPANAAKVERLVTVLASLCNESAKHCLFRIADEASRSTKATLARALHGNTTAEARAVLVHLLSDGESRMDALVAIAKRPWPEVLPALIELAEAESDAAALTIGAIVECGTRGSSNEASAAVDFLFEQLDDDATALAATVALFDPGLGRAFPALTTIAKTYAGGPGMRRIPSLCLVAADARIEDASLAELALAARKCKADATRRLLEQLRTHADDRIRSAAERVTRALP